MWSASEGIACVHLKAKLLGNLYRFTQGGTALSFGFRGRLRHQVSRIVEKLSDRIRTATNHVFPVYADRRKPLEVPDVRHRWRHCCENIIHKFFQRFDTPRNVRWKSALVKICGLRRRPAVIGGRPGGGIRCDFGRKSSQAPSQGPCIWSDSQQMRLRVALLKLDHEVVVRIVEDAEAASWRNLADHSIIDRAENLGHDPLNLEAYWHQQEASHSKATVRYTPVDLMVIGTVDRMHIIYDAAGDRAVEVGICEPHHGTRGDRQNPGSVVEIALQLERRR